MHSINFLITGKVLKRCNVKQSAFSGILLKQECRFFFVIWEGLKLKELMKSH